MLQYSTLASRASDRKELWSTQLSKICGHTPHIEFSDRDFSGEIAAGMVGGINLAKLSHNALRVERPAADKGLRHVILMMQLGGRSRVGQNGHEAFLEIGDGLLLDSRYAFSIGLDGPTSQILAYLPAEEVLAGGERLPRMQVHKSGKTAGLLARPVLESLLNNITSVDEADGTCARSMLVEIVRTMVACQKPARPNEKEALPNSRIRAFIEAHLGDPDLAPAHIAAACGITTRQLHRLFEVTQWSSRSWIRQQRLQRCQADLQDPAMSHLSITQIAFRWGFNDAAHFSRVFRETFDVSPTDLRKAAKAVRPH